MVEVPTELYQRLQRTGQEHVLFGWQYLTEHERLSLVEQLQQIDLDSLATLYALRDQRDAVPPLDRLAPLPVTDPATLPPETRQLGESALRQGQVAALVVAGGQGTRLGFDLPKGIYPIGPVSRKSLFQLHAEKVLALTRRFGCPVPLLIMTSPATHAETHAFFNVHQHFGLPASDVYFFQQGTMPALDLASGKLLLEKPGVLAVSPNGHGGTLTALAESGLLTTLRQRGIRYIYYFQVDNALLHIADPLFIGHHIHAQAEVSVKVIEKEYPAEKMGVFVLVDGRCGIIEYSDLPDELAQARDADGRLRYRAANPAIHVFDLDLLSRITTGPTRLPWHVARKKVPHINERGDLVRPERENALKFEMFIFDALPLAQRWTALATTREAEFVPLKNATGPDSPDTVQAALIQQARRLLLTAGVRHIADVPVEVSPLAVDTLTDWVRQHALTQIDQPTYVAG